jgi:FAD/FMN-containing dehydrogenase
VLADGRLVGCDPDHHPELFWALRGPGGGQFAAVTQLAWRTIPAPDATGFHLAWPWTAAAAVASAWQAWAPEAPNETAASLLIRAPRERNRPPLVTVLGATLDHEPGARATLNQLVTTVGTPPVNATYASGRNHEIKRYLAEYDANRGRR